MYFGKVYFVIFIYKFVPVIMLDSNHKYFIDYSENVEFIQELTGHDVKLQCNLDGLLNKQQLTHEKVQWFFKQCSDTKNNEIENCQAVYAKDWTQLPCEQQFCQQNLLLRNVTEKYSGYYKCTVQPQFKAHVQKLDIKLVRTFQLEIQNTTSLLPEFIADYPQNRTALQGNQVVLQCRVNSEEHPTIRWFKRFTTDVKSLQATEVKSPHIVQYNGYNYKLLNTAREKLIDNQVYLSKLILNNVQSEDEGFYACVAISYRGYSMREAYLQIKSQEWNDYNEDIEEHTSKSEFWLLFLMPVGLAVLPLSFWLSYCFYKHLNKKNQLRKWSLQYSDEETGVEHFILHS